MSYIRNVRSAPALVTGLLALTVAAHVWAASTPLPFGGPNVVMAALTVAATVAYVAWSRHFAVDGLTRLVLAFALCLLLWAAVSTLMNDQYPSHLTRLGQTTMGIAILWVVSMTIQTLPRVRIVNAAIVVTTFVSALVGICILVQGEPFLSLWLRIAQVAEPNVQSALNGRIAGLASHTSVLAYQLAVAIPLAIGLLLIPVSQLYSHRNSDKRGGVPNKLGTSRDEWICRGVVIAVLTVMMTALILNATRSTLLGVFCGGLVALSPLLLKPPGLRRMAGLLSVAIVLASTWAIVTLVDDLAFNQRVLSVQDRSARARLPMAITAVRYAVEYPFGTVVYQPEPRHLPSGLEPALQREVLRHIPHNQFLGVLVKYGWPGLVLLMVFYAVVLSAFVSMIRQALKLMTAGPIVLVAALAGCMGAYVCNSLFQPAGPFVGDWYHWIVIGLVFSTHAMLKREIAAR